MESKHKNALIGGLLAIVFIMAVGFAGFTQKLTIKDTTSVTSNWKIGFESVTPSPTCATSANKCGAATGFTAGDKTLTLNTKLASPSDVVTYTVVVKNYGNVNAKIAANGITMTPTKTGNNTVIRYAQSGLTAGTTTVAAGATVSFTVTVTFEQTEGQIEAAKLSNGLTMNIDWEQA